MRSLYIIVLLALVAAALAVTTQDTQQFIDGVKKDISAILNVVDSEKLSINNQIEQLQISLKLKELEAAIAEYEIIVSQKRLEQQKYVESQVVFMNNLISNPTALKTNEASAGKIPSRPIDGGRSCLEVLSTKKNAFTGGLHFFLRKRKTVPEAPAVLKQIYCADDGSTLVGTVNFEFKRASGSKLIPTLLERSKEMNADDLAQTKCQSFEDCFMFLPKFTKNLEVVLTYMVEVVNPVSNKKETEEKLLSFKIKTANEQIRVQVMMQKLFSLLEKTDVLKEKGLKCAFNQATGLSICGNEADLITPDNVKTAAIMRLYMM